MKKREKTIINRWSAHENFSALSIAKVHGFFTQSECFRTQSISVCWSLTDNLRFFTSAMSRSIQLLPLRPIYDLLNFFTAPSRTQPTFLRFVPIKVSVPQKVTSQAHSMCFYSLSPKRRQFSAFFHDYKTKYKTKRALRCVWREKTLDNKQFYRFVTFLFNLLLLFSCLYKN